MGSKKTNYKYDVRGNLVEVSTIKGPLVFYSYDSLNRLTEIIMCRGFDEDKTVIIYNEDTQVYSTTRSSSRYYNDDLHVYSIYTHYYEDGLLRKTENELFPELYTYDYTFYTPNNQRSNKITHNIQP